MRRAGWLWCLVALTMGACGAHEPSLVRESAAAPTVETTAEPTTTAPPEPTTTEAPATTAPPPTTSPTTSAPATTVVARAAAKAKAPPLQAATRVVGSIEAYAGLGTWVDVYDWSHYRNTTPTVGPDQVDEMAAAGVQTIFLQTAKNDTPDPIAEPELLLPIIQRAHQRGLRVVAWYLPTLEDVDNDLNRLLASAQLDVDGLAVDIEARNVGDVAERNRRLIDLSTRLRAALPGRAIGAIVLPPVVLEVVNPNYWPDFPYAEIAPSYDVWQTMGYWTNRKADSGYRDPYRYTDENIRRLRNNLGNPLAPVHPVGGVGSQGPDDVEAFLRAAVENGAIGGSVYDWRTTRAEAWPSLRKFRSG
ncbi:MAG: hypothetical protein QOF60_2308 [Actinomycetota bacterium]|nr:hypothetical protein [Actinomycetota bacterium]